MLPAAQRLHEGSVFRDVTRRGRRSSSRLLVAYLLETDVADSAAPARVGFIVSKAVGNAVVRNRVQRRLRHAVRAMVPGLPAGSVLVVRALPASAVAEYAALQDQLGRAVLRLTSVPVA